MQISRLNVNGQRWVSELSEFRFDIHYRQEVVNKDANCLSRLPLDIDKYTELCSEDVSLDVFEAFVPIHT